MDRSSGRLQLSLQELLASTVFSPHQLALYIRAIYAAPKPGSEAGEEGPAKGLLACDTLAAGLDGFRLREGLWVEMGQRAQEG